MIFVTVGTQKPFPRLVALISDWASLHPDTVIVLQHGGADMSDLPGNFTAEPSLSPTAFNGRLRAAEVVVAHAGIGTILSAREAGKPVVIVPRRADQGEHRNDHQLDTVDALRDLPGVWVADDAASLEVVLDQARSQGPGAADTIGPESIRLARFVQGFMTG